MASSTPSAPPIHDPSLPSAPHAVPHNSTPHPHNSTQHPHYLDIEDEHETVEQDMAPTPHTPPSPEIRLFLHVPYLMMVVCTLADLFLSMLARGLDNVPSTRNINWGKMAIQAVFYLSCVPLSIYSTCKGPRHWLPYLVVILLIAVAIGFTNDTQFVVISSAIAIVYGFKHADASSLSFLPFLQPVLRLLFNIPGRHGTAAPHNQDMEMGMAPRPALQHGQHNDAGMAPALHASATPPAAAIANSNPSGSSAAVHSNTNNLPGSTTQPSS